MPNEYIVITISALAGIFISWLITYLFLKQKYESKSEQLKMELNSELDLREERLNRLEFDKMELQKQFDETLKQLSSEKERSVSLEQDKAVMAEKISNLNDKVTQYEALKKEHKDLEEAYEKNTLELNRSLSAAKSNLQENEKNLSDSKEEIKELKAQKEDLQRELSSLKSKISELETRLESERKNIAEKLELLDESRERMKLEFKELADSILKNNSEHFSTQNSEKLSEMINPIKKQFKEFKEQINEVYIKETKERSALQNELKHIKEINRQMSEEAKNLTNALKGESKTQGIWGEMILERVLENSGLREGESYKREVSLEHENEKGRFRPDVVVYLPDSREIIIDAKTSLTAYEKYISEEDESKKKIFARQHFDSVKKHINELSDKDYTGLKGLDTLDFIFMFIPIESALLMAMEYDPGLFNYAFKKNVILVGPTTLMVALRAVENTWKQEHQQRNAREIAKRAGLLYDKFVGVVESVEKLGKNISALQNTYEDISGKLYKGGGNLGTQIQKLQDLGAASNKKLPDHISRDLEP